MIKPVEVSSQAVANSLLLCAGAEGRPLTNMQLQKLVFLSQGYSLALLGDPIYYHNTHAWQWGPVIPKLYKKLQKYGSGEVTEPLEIPSDDKAVLNEDQQKVIRSVWNSYKLFSGSQLSELTHRKGTPWSKTWDSEQFGIIPIEEIRDYYTKLTSKAQ